MVTQGLNSGDRIVLYGIQKVRPGIVVRPELTKAPSDQLAAETVETAAEAGAEGESPEQAPVQSAD